MEQQRGEAVSQNASSPTPETRELEPLSDFWRKRRSDRLEEELVNVLNGARGYVGFFGSDFSIDWGSSKSSSVSPSHKRIELDYSPLKDKTPPYDGKDIDIVMGTSIHESGHIKWSYPPEKVREYYAKKCHAFYGRGKYARTYFTHEQEKEASELQTVANVIEDFYVENKVSETYPTLGAYLRESRKLAVKSEIPHNLLYDLSTDNPSYDSLVTMWAAIALIDKEIPKTASKISKKFLNKLINHTVQTANAKPDRRLQISYKIWDELKAMDRASQKDWQRQIKQMKQEREQKQEQSQEDTEKTQEQPEQKSDKTEQEPSDVEEKDNSQGEQEKEAAEDKEETGEGAEEQDTEEAGDDKTDTEDDRKMESQKAPEELEEDEGGAPEIEEDLDEPYQSHEELRDCYSINLNDKESIPQTLKDAIDIYQEKMPEDITQQVNEMLGGSGGAHIVMELAHADLHAANKHFLETRRIAQKVSKLFIYDKKLRTRYRRGLLEGTVDPRRLYRAGAMDYKLFERREILAAPSLAVGILVDASGSMGRSNYKGDSLNSALRTAMALKTALAAVEGVDLMITAYDGGIDTTLYRVFDRRTDGFRPNIDGGGGTPSGYAISGMVSQIGRYLIGKDKLIIHITDGAPDSHERVAQAVDYCKEHRIDVMTLTLAHFSDDVKESYRGLCEYLDDIEKLPDAIASLLKKRLQKRMMRIR